MTVFNDEQLEQMGLRYYNADIHKTAFILPRFAKKVTTTEHQTRARLPAVSFHTVVLGEIGASERLSLARLIADRVFARPLDCPERDY